jgi:tetratricopeptide (TPR) repeat protein
MMNRKKTAFWEKPCAVLFFILAPFLLDACSSAPKRPAETFSIRQLGENQLDLVNKAVDQGDYERAFGLLTEARRLAVSADYPSLLVRTKLAEGGVLYNQGKAEQAEAAWSAALLEAESSGETELSAQTRIYLARNALITKKAPPDEVAAQVAKEIASIKKDTLAIALGWNVIGLAEKEKRNYAVAEMYFKKALAIHDKANYLEQAAYDWYLIASSRSLSGQFATALEALNAAIQCDRKAENTWGLASDWRAMGDVYKKAGKTAEAKAAYARAAAIYRSINKEREAEDAEKRLQ